MLTKKTFVRNDNIFCTHCFCAYFFFFSLCAISTACEEQKKRRPQLTIFPSHCPESRKFLSLSRSGMNHCCVSQNNDTFRRQREVLQLARSFRSQVVSTERSRSRCPIIKSSDNRVVVPRRKTIYGLAAFEKKYNRKTGKTSKEKKK